MADITNELMYERLKRIRGDISILKEGQRDMRQDMFSLRNQFHLMQGDFNHMRASMTHVEARLDRIENRLELREFSEAQSRFEPHP